MAGTGTQLEGEEQEDQFKYLWHRALPRGPSRSRGYLWGSA